MRTRNDELYPHSEEANGAPAIGIADILLTLRRGWPLALFGCLIGLMLAVSYIIFTPALFKSSARILIDLSVNRYLQSNKIVDEPTFHQAEIEIGNQVYILSSESIIRPVVKSMNLAHDSEFVGVPKVASSSVDKLKQFVKQSIGWNREADAAIDPDAALERTAIENVLTRLSVFKEPIGNVINVSFASPDSKKAAAIANAVVDTYVAITLEAKLNSTKTMGRWLQDRLNELKEQAVEADRALQDYKIANNLIGSSKGVLGSDELARLSLQLTEARIAMAEAKSRLDRIQQMSDEEVFTAADTEVRLMMMAASKSGAHGSTSFALNNTDFVKLRAEYRDVVTKMSEVEPRVGRQHEVVGKLRKRMGELRDAMRTEGQRIIDSYAAEYEVAKERESQLVATLARSIGETEVGNQAQVKMRELESSAATIRNLYNSFLQKSSEINTIQVQNVPVQDVRIISRAMPELQKSYKKTAAVLAGGIILGLCLGAGAALAREWVADVFRTPKGVEQVTEIRCVILPTVKAKLERIGRLWRRTKSRPIEEFVLDAPYSRFAESLRKVKVLVDSARLAPTAGANVVGVVSSVAGEGKTTIAANLAALMIASSGARTLVIDADLHRRLLTAALAPDAREGLIECLEDPSRLSSLVYKREQSGLDVLPCVLSTRVSNAAEVLGSPKMEQLLTVARKAYDYIIIEIAPMTSVVDVKMIERFIDSFVFVIEWGRTKKSLVLEALSEAQSVRERVVAMVLNKADLRSIESYKGDRFKQYYEE